MEKTLYQRVLQLAAEQRRSLEEPCLELHCTVCEFEQRLTALEPEVLLVVDRWLGTAWRRLWD